MSLQTILDTVRFKELVSNSLNTYRSNYVVNYKEYTLIAIKRVDIPVKCQSEHIDGTKCGRAINNVMVVKDRNGNIINVGTTCYKRTMNVTDTKCPKEGSFNDFRADKQLYHRVKVELDSKVNQLIKQLPTMITAAKMIDLNANEAHFRKLIKDGKINEAITELMVIQTKYAEHKKRYQLKAHDPEYMKKFKRDMLKALSYVDHLATVKAPQPVLFDKALYEALLNHFSEPVVRELFKHYGKELPSSVKTSKITSSNPW